MAAAGAPTMTATAINPRLAGLRESATLAMNQKSRALRAAGREVALFGFGESPFAVHPKMQAALAAAAGEKSYLPALGLPRLREAVAAHHRRATGLDFSAARIAVAPGSKEAIFHLLYALAGPLILPLPAWVSYAPQARLLGKTTLAVETDYASGYKIDPARLDSVLAQADAPQSVMILTSPNNPSGQGYAESEWREIAAVCRRRNVFVIADEIYAELTFSDSDSIAPSFAVHCPERVVVTGGLSKSRAAGGWRLGFAAAASPRLDNVFAALAALISETYSCVCAPLQHAAIVAYEDDEDFRLRARLRRAVAVGFGMDAGAADGGGDSLLAGRGRVLFVSGFFAFRGSLARARHRFGDGAVRGFARRSRSRFAAGGRFWRRGGFFRGSLGGGRFRRRGVVSRVSPKRRRRHRRPPRDGMDSEYRRRLRALARVA